MEQHNSNKQSFEAVKAQNSKRGEQRNVDNDDASGGGGDGGGVGGGKDQGKRAVSSIGVEMKKLAQSETLASTEHDLRFNSGQQLSEVPVEYVLEPLETTEGVKARNNPDQVRVNHCQTSIKTPGQSAQVGIQNQLGPSDDPSSSELSPTSVTQSISSIPSPTLQEQKLSSVNRALACISEISGNSLNHKSLSLLPLLKKPSPDGYNWRKYGQKQVKSPQGSRSYYRCTYSDCYAKKIECSDHTSQVIEIVYKSQHSHDPPRKVSSSTPSRLALPAVPVNGHDSAAHSVTTANDSVPSASSKGTVQLTPASELKEQSTCGSDDNSEINVKDEDIYEPETKKSRLKKCSSDCSGTSVKPGKKPKFVVHAAGDVGISGDGYRWRKYGQKMVKGNPHPRNYYRCTSAGCPVRKHIETAVDNTNAVVITYKGKHDHDMPVPKKHQGLPNAPLVAAAAPVSISNLEVKKSEQLQTQISTTKWSVDKDGELTGEPLELGKEKAIESARTLLSIGFEIKPC